MNRCRFIPSSHISTVVDTKCRGLGSTRFLTPERIALRLPSPRLRMSRDRRAEVRAKEGDQAADVDP
jgi:hypothetical protein